MTTILFCTIRCLRNELILCSSPGLRVRFLTLTTEKKLRKNSVVNRNKSINVHQLSDGRALFFSASPVGVSLCDVDARQGGDGQACGSGTGHRILFRCERPAPVPLLFCLSPWQWWQLQVARKPPVDFAHLYPEGVGCGKLSHMRLLILLSVNRKKGNWVDDE